MKSFAIKNKQTVLFTGDSITDCNRADLYPPLGNGYVSIFNRMLIVTVPERKITIVNKGISGNKITDLEKRWTDDVLMLSPHWLSIMIGINDLHSYIESPKDGVGPDLFYQTYDFLLYRTKKTLNINIILIEPFYIAKIDSKDEFHQKVFNILPEYIDIVEKMAKKYKTAIIRMHRVFQEFLRYYEPEVFSLDSVHPNETGHFAIANELMKVF